MDEEGISKLPGPILHHILSFLDDKNVVRTCVVSKSWCHLVSTRPKFSLNEFYFRKDKEKFRNVLDKSLQVYYDQKLCIEELRVSCWFNVIDREKLVSLLKKWIPIVAHDFGVKKFDLSFVWKNSAYFDLLAAMVFESESLQELCLDQCKLSQINCIGKNNHLKTLRLYNVYLEEDESFAKLMSSCPLIERFSLVNCKGLTTIKMHHNNHNLKSLELCQHKIYLPIGYKKYFPSLITCLRLQSVPLSNEWFDSFSLNFPCLEDLQLCICSGFDELKLSSRSVKNLDIKMHKSTIKATIDAPSIKKFHYNANISQSISFKPTSNEWKSEIRLELNNQVSQWFLEISEFVAALSQSQINSLALSDFELSGFCIELQHSFEHLPDHIPVCCGSHEMPVSIGSLGLSLTGLYYESFFSDLVNGLFRIFRPREIKLPVYVKNAQDEENQKNRNEVDAREEKHHAVVELLWKILFTEKSDDQTMFCWLRAHPEETSWEFFDKQGDMEWHLVQGTISCSQVAALLKKPGLHKLRIPLK